MSEIHGVAAALVTNVSDPEGLGRIKLNFPWLDDEHETDWVRIATPMAGGGRGMHLIPEVNDEALVAFEHGDVRFPYVLGFLWNGQDATPADHVRLRRIQSLNGHRITFVDEPPSSGSCGALLIEDCHGNKITLSNGKVVIKSVGVLELEAPNITLQGPASSWKRVVTPNSNPI